MNITQLQKALATTLILCTLIMFSCKNETKKEAGITFTEHTISEEIHLFGNENYPAFNLDVRIKLPEDKNTYQGLHQAMMKSYFDSLYLPQNTIQENLETFVQAHVSDYRAIEKELQLDSMDISSSFNWEMIENNQILNHNEYFVSFVNELFSYTGGAHGNTIRNNYVYDLKNERILLAEDILNLEQCESIIDLQKKSAEKAGLILDVIAISIS
jgi:DNA gyrase/topoisomerase IV subunit B